MKAGFPVYARTPPPPFPAERCLLGGWGWGWGGLSYSPASCHSAFVSRWGISLWAVGPAAVNHQPPVARGSITGSAPETFPLALLPPPSSLDFLAPSWANRCFHQLSGWYLWSPVCLSALPCPIPTLPGHPQLQPAALSAPCLWACWSTPPWPLHQPYPPKG